MESTGGGDIDITVVRAHVLYVYWVAQALSRFQQNSDGPKPHFVHNTYSVICSLDNRPPRLGYIIAVCLHNKGPKHIRAW
jgi:hypothetical protein